MKPLRLNPIASFAALAIALMFATACASGGGGAGPGKDGAPLSFFQTTDSTQMMRVIDLRPDLSRDSLWAIVSTAIDRRYTIETRDRAAGLVQSTWRPFVDNDGIPDLRYRRRVSVQFLGTDWRRLQIKSEATFQSLTGYDRDFLIEAMSELRTRAGRG